MAPGLTAMSRADDLVTAIEQVTGRQGKRSGRNTRVVCPAHDDHNPSLDIAENDQGEPLVKCRSCGAGLIEVCQAIGREPAAYLETSETSEWTPQGPAVAVYDYTDATGRLLYQVCRTADKQFPQRRPDPTAPRGWRWNLEGVQRVLYRLPEVLAAAANSDTIYICEGEKDADAIRRAGATATCNPGGAGKWRTEYNAALHGAHIVIVADKDQAGIAHAHNVAAALAAEGNGFLDAVQIVQAAEGKDAADHLAAGHTLADLQPLEHVADQTSYATFALARDFIKLDLPKSSALIGHTRGGTNLLPSHGWMMLWGPAGSAKTSLLIDLAFHATTGRNWLGYPVNRPLKMILVVNEGVPGGLQDKLAEKLELWDGDTTPILERLAVYVSPWGEFTFGNSDMVDALTDYATAFQADYVMLDPLHTIGAGGSGTPEETEKFKHLLRQFGVWNSIGVITAHHANKSRDVSGDWERHPDTVISVEKDGKRPATKYTLRKARPADPAELHVPRILEWLPETAGYKAVEIDQRPKVTDDEILERIRHALHDTPGLNMTALRKAVPGDDNRIGELVKTEIETGRIANASPKANAFSLTLCDTTNTDDTDSDLLWR